MADLSKTVSIIFQGVNNTGAALTGVANGLDQIGTEAGQAVPQIQKVGDEAEKLGSTNNGVDALVVSLKALAAAVVVKEFIDANKAYEQFIKTMESAGKTQEEAAAEFEYIREVSNRLGVEVFSTADAYSKFAAAAKGTALEGEAAREIFEAFAGQMARTGASAADVSGAMTQLAQGVSKGKFELDDLKSIAERIPGFFKAFADSLGITTENLYEQISAGQIGGDELLKFAQKANQALADVDFDGFTASTNRFKNAVSDIYIEIGKTGAFDALTGAVQGGTIAIATLLNGFIALGEIAGAVAGALATGNFAGLGEAISAAYDKAIEKTSKTFENVLGVERVSKAAGDAGKKAGDDIAEGAEKAALSAKDLAKESSELDKALKALGIDPKQFKDPIDEIVKAFEEIASNPAVRGDQFLTGLLVTLDKIQGGEAIAKVGDAIEGAFKRGALTADEYKVAVDALGQKQSGVFDKLPEYSKKVDDNSKAVQKQAQETQKAKEAAEKYALEMEKIASNERIKLIEAKISFDIAQLEEDTKRIEATFASIDNTVNSTGELIGDLFGILKDYDNLSFGAIRLIEQQLESENKARQEAFALQKALTEATIEEMRARTQSLINGDPLITINGDGLQPHLEAFMWEILKTIQTRVNADGLKLLLGV